ncbi:hypothetical protein Salat_0670000 [Sesamum alatum]|uniref:Secreted protein n=1 Tax=Sesamum alatum TaxID=300844 RepID=A0AAE1YRY6_9LAMI|nr:hypothetical protein Salat_0670000 [Sesamum alatum]
MVGAFVFSSISATTWASDLTTFFPFVRFHIIPTSSTSAVIWCAGSSGKQTQTGTIEGSCAGVKVGDDFGCFDSTKPVTDDIGSTPSMQHHAIFDFRVLQGTDLGGFE